MSMKSSEPPMDGCKIAEWINPQKAMQGKFFCKSRNSESMEIYHTEKLLNEYNDDIFNADKTALSACRYG